MAILYSLLCSTLWIVGGYAWYRAGKANKRYVRTDKQVNELNKKLPPETDIRNHLTDYIQLSDLQLRRTKRAESTVGWTTLAKWFTDTRTAMKGWYGRKVPYAAGVIDTSLTVWLLHHFGAVDWNHWLEAVKMSMSRIAGV